MTETPLERAAKAAKMVEVEQAAEANAAKGGKFERVDFYRLAEAFGVPIEKVHDAVGFTGMLYRQRANPDRVMFLDVGEMSDGAQVALMKLGISPVQYEAIREIIRDDQA